MQAYEFRSRELLQKLYSDYRDKKPTSLYALGAYAGALSMLCKAFDKIPEVVEDSVSEQYAHDLYVTELQYRRPRGAE